MFIVVVIVEAPKTLLNDLLELPKFEQQGRVRVPEALEGDSRQFV